MRRASRCGNHSLRSYQAIPFGATQIERESITARARQKSAPLLNVKREIGVVTGQVVTSEIAD